MKNKILNILSILAIALATGCGKSEEPQSAPAQNNTDYLGAVAQAQKAIEKTVDAVNIQKAIDAFYVSENAYPKTLKEVVDKGYLPALPELPADFEYSYDAQNGKVKAVRKSK